MLETLPKQNQNKTQFFQNKTKTKPQLYPNSQTPFALARNVFFSFCYAIRNIHLSQRKKILLKPIN